MLHCNDSTMVCIIDMSDEFSTVSAFSDLLSTVTQLGEILRQQGWTVSCAESCTGGGIAYVLTSVAGSSDWFNQSWVTYSNQAKQQCLGVTPSTLNHHGAVSQQTVEQMVNGVVENSGAEVGVSVSGIAGPGGGTKEKPVGTVWFGFSIDGQLYLRCCQFDGDRLSVREQAIHFAIDFLYQRLVAE